MRMVYGLLKTPTVFFSMVNAVKGSVDLSCCILNVVVVKGKRVKEIWL